MVTDQPLADLRIIAVEQYGAGPFATQQLAELGAEVIKVEDPTTGGDVGRRVPPDGDGVDSLFFQSLNHGKRSLALNLRAAAGREVLRELVADADVVFSNLRGDVPARLGLLYDDLCDVNPGLVCCSLSAFGMTGPRASQPGYDYLVQGLAGWMSLTGAPGGPPTKSGLSLVDWSSGYVAAAAMLAAVHQARRTGRGQDLDLSLYDVGMNLLTYVATWELSGGHRAGRLEHSAHPTLVPFQSFATSDGWIVVACAKESFWQRLVAVLDDPGFERPEYATFEARLEHRDELVAALSAAFRSGPTEGWIERLEAAGVPVAPVNSVSEALEDPQATARDLFIRFPHERYGEVGVVRSPLRFAPSPRPSRAAPRLGESTDEVLRAVVGADDATIDRWRRAGAFAANEEE